MRKLSILSVGFVVGCSVEPEGGVTFGGVGSGASTNTPGTDASSDDGEAASEGEATSNADPSAVTNPAADESSEGGGDDATSLPDPSTSGSDDGVVDESGSEGADNEDDAYQACSSNDECMSDPGLACLTADENGAGGFCSPACGTLGASPPDAQLCPNPPLGITATKVCLEGLVRNCALSCAGGLNCPAGTECLPANGGAGPYCFGSA